MMEKEKPLIELLGKRKGKTPITVAEDLYNSKELRQEVCENIVWLNSVLRENNIRRCLVGLEHPVPLTAYKEGLVYLSREEMESRGLTESDGEVVRRLDTNEFSWLKVPYQGYLSEVKAGLSKKHDQGVAEAADRDLGKFIEKQVLGVHPYQRHKIDWGGPVQAGDHAHNLHAVEVWVHQPRGGHPYAINTALYGFTAPTATSVKGADPELITAAGVSHVAAAFTRNRGCGFPVASLYSLLGRSMIKNREEAIEKWFRENRDERNLYWCSEVVDYVAVPFTTPADVVFYPHPEEYGVQGYYNEQFLEPSLRAKEMMKHYFELVTGKRFPVKTSMSVQGLKVIKD